MRPGQRTWLHACSDLAVRFGAGPAPSPRILFGGRRGNGAGSRPRGVNVLAPTAWGACGLCWIPPRIRRAGAARPGGTVYVPTPATPRIRRARRAATASMSERNGCATGFPGRARDYPLSCLVLRKTPLQTASSPMTTMHMHMHSGFTRPPLRSDPLSSRQDSQRIQKQYEFMEIHTVVNHQHPGP